MASQAKTNDQKRNDVVKCDYQEKSNWITGENNGCQEQNYANAEISEIKRICKVPTQNGLEPNREMTELH